MDSSALLAKRKLAPGVIATYEKRLASLQGQILLLNSVEVSDTTEREVLALWISNNEEWLQNNGKAYEAAKLLVQIPLDKLEEIDKDFAAVYFS